MTYVSYILGTFVIKKKPKTNKQKKQLTLRVTLRISGLSSAPYQEVGELPASPNDYFLPLYYR